MGRENKEQVGAAGTVTVTGAGWAEAAPDVMLVSIGVECRDRSVDAAYSAAGADLAAVADVFRSRGVAAADIRTTGLTVRADLVWREGEGQQVAGYIAVSSLSVRLLDVGTASGTIADAVRAGGNNVRLNSLQLTLSNDFAVREQARAAAWQDALQAARQFAGLASATLGQVVSVTEHSPGQGPAPLAGIQRASAVESVAIEPGESRVDSAVTVVWELQPGLPA
ncbi:SIMPL domain-containing protein [Pseudarthrobacter sp. NS4]|uniref:SIMPL domain-containing protein n=1 Tax=Pseudarthrobacter sp. NS4 TaxID=2973976 RepID=UPI002161CF61|nr:SIMPL domain-containing protein [Pseudarthrobacter sp. NS4]